MTLGRSWISKFVAACLLTLSVLPFTAPFASCDPQGSTKHPLDLVRGHISHDAALVKAKEPARRPIGIVPPVVVSLVPVLPESPARLTPSVRHASSTPRQVLRL
jgi:hypothetical protein